MNIEEAENRLFQLKQSMELLDLVTGKTIEEDTKLNIKAIETVLSELEKKEAIINEMSNFINLMGNELVAETGDNNLEFCKRQKCIDNEELDCEECIKEYFTKKVEKEGIKDE